MDVKENATIGSLQIATDVLVKIAQQAAQEIEGVAAVQQAVNSVRTAVASRLQRPVNVVILDGVAQITVHVVVRYGVRIPPLCERVQENIKTAVQSMTGVTVARVNVVVAGIAPEPAPQQ